MQEAPGVTVHRAITHTLLAELRSSAEQPDIARPEHARDAISMTDSLPHKHCLPHWPASWLIQLSRPVRALQGGSGACCWDMAWAQAGWSPLPSAPEAQPMSGGAWACVGTHPGVCIRCPLTHPACPQTGVPSHILVSPARSPHTSWCLHQVSRLLHAQPVAMAVCRPAPQLGCGWPEGWDGLSWSGAQCLCVGSHPGRRVCAPWLLGCSGDHRERVTNTDCSQPGLLPALAFEPYAQSSEKETAILPTEALQRAALLSCAVRQVMAVTTVFQRALYQGLSCDKGAELQGTEVNSGWHSCWLAANSQILLYCFSLCVTCDPLGFH